MREIRAQEKSIRMLLSEKYAVDSYQREYKWEEKQIDDLVDDLLATFSEDYKDDHEQIDVKKYGQYFLGPIIVSTNDDKRYIIDGQQRLTSLTLMLICLLHLTDNENHKTTLRNLIYSDEYGQLSFNLNVPERVPCLHKLYQDEKYDIDGESESVRNLVERYFQLKEKLSDGLTSDQTPLFIDWLTNKVYLVEIKTPSGTDAYKIFESMNDRGLRLTPAEMLKGYLLTEIREENLREQANKEWKKQIDKLIVRKGEDADFIKSWLRARYTKKLADFEEIGSQFHRWVRDNSKAIGLKSSNDFANFITHNFSFYAKQFIRLRSAAEKIDAEHGLECVYYLAQHSFTLQYPLLLASLSPNDSSDDINRKLRVVSTYLDILIHRRIGNWKWISESSMRSQIFPLIPEIHNLSVMEITDFLFERLEKTEPGPTLAPEFGMHKQNRPRIKRILARITDYVEMQSTNTSNYAQYFSRGKASFEIEHIWHANYREVCNEESMNENNLSEDRFREMRNNIGGLVLLPKRDNASYNDCSYAIKREYYQTQNLLAGSLHENSYNARIGIRKFKEQSELPFKSHSEFKESDLEDRQKLYREIADKIWHPDRLYTAVNN